MVPTMLTSGTLIALLPALTVPLIALDACRKLAFARCISVLYTHTAAPRFFVLQFTGTGPEGGFEEGLFMERVVKIILDHDVSNQEEPLFLYYAMHTSCVGWVHAQKIIAAVNAKQLVAAKLFGFVSGNIH